MNFYKCMVNDFDESLSIKINLFNYSIVLSNQIFIEVVKFKKGYFMSFLKLMNLNYSKNNEQICFDRQVCFDKNNLNQTSFCIVCNFSLSILVDLIKKKLWDKQCVYQVNM
ncbi:hypothetical protein B0E44_02625 [Flavobacterium sp. A45]|nr:hypothetical protein B0E44_02625 [Flavobacterium sp. A45]